MLVSSGFIALVFRIINFFALIALFWFLYKRNKVGEDIAQSIAQEEAALQQLQNKTYALMKRRSEVAQEIKAQEALAQKLTRHINRWRAEVERVRAHEAAAWQEQQQIIKKTMRMRTECMAASRRQQEIFPQVLGVLKVDLIQKFQDQAAGKKYIADIMHTIKKGAA